MQRTMVNVAVASSETDVFDVRDLFLEYAATLPVDLGYQDFKKELAALPGDYGPPHGCLLIARHAEAALACVGVRPWDDHRCELKRLYVRPAGRGMGLGRRLTEEAIAFARAAGYLSMRLDTLPTMGTAQALYRQLGFREIEAYRGSPVAGNLYMELTLERRV